MKNKITIHWFRSDLRLEDNLSLANSCNQSRIIPVYIFDETNRVDFHLGASHSWLKEAGVTMGEAYPCLIVDLSTSRKTALEAFKTLENNNSY